MLVPFEELSEESRIWIYQGNRLLSNDEETLIESLFEEFLQEWTAHGADLKAGLRIEKDLFLIIGLDEDFNRASGCSIDKLVHFIQHIESKISIDFFDRKRTALSFGNSVNLRSTQEIKKDIERGIIPEDQLIFVNTILTKKDLNKNWIVPVNQSWLKRYLPQQENV
jgi:hypothetical protein